MVAEQVEERKTEKTQLQRGVSLYMFFAKLKNYPGCLILFVVFDVLTLSLINISLAEF